MKPAVQLGTYIDHVVHNDKDPKFKVGDHIRISKYKNIFATIYTPNWSEEVFMIEKVKDTVPWTYVISDLHNKDFVRTFSETSCRRPAKQNLELKK